MPTVRVNPVGKGRNTECPGCGLNFTAKRSDSKYCSHACAVRHAPGRRGKPSPLRIRADNDPRLRRFQREQAAPGLTQKQRGELLSKWRRQQRACAYCPNPATTVDHVVPLVRGGTNHEGNLTPACRACNSSKAGWFLVEWRTGRRLPRRTTPLPWVQRAPKPVTIKQTVITFCPVCGEVHDRPKYCSDACSREQNARDVRNAYRRSVGLPVDNRPRTRRTAA